MPVFGSPAYYRKNGLPMPGHERCFFCYGTGGDPDSTRCDDCRRCCGTGWRLPPSVRDELTHLRELVYAEMVRRADDVGWLDEVES